MSEKELNEQYIKNKIQGICQDCMWFDKTIPIINTMLSEAYISGLEQGKFDTIMDLQQKVEQLKKELEQKEAILGGIQQLEYKCEHLEEENKILKENAEHNDKVVDKVNWENMLLKGKNEQIENIRKEAKKKINNMFDNGYETRIIDDLLELENILNKGNE